MNNDLNKETKQNNRNRFFYSFSFIVALVLISIIYASLAINVGVKINNKKSLSPQTTPIEEKKESLISKDYKPPKEGKTKYKGKGKKPTPKPTPVIPVIVPDDINWKIVFKNINIDNGSVRAVSDAMIMPSNTEVEYEIVLREPGEYYSFTVNVENDGNVDAKIYDIVRSGITTEQEKFLTFEVTYLDGTPISKNDTLLKGKSKTIKVMTKFRDDVSDEDLPSTSQTLKLVYKLIYIQK